MRSPAERRAPEGLQSGESAVGEIPKIGSNGTKLPGPPEIGRNPKDFGVAVYRTRFPVADIFEHRGAAGVRHTIDNANGRTG